MSRTRMHAVAVSAAVIVVTSSYVLGTASADGIPVMEPLVYTGTLLEDGVAVNGTRGIAANIWRSVAGTSSAEVACTTLSRPTPIDGGRFELALDQSCVRAVSETPDLWIEIQVDGATVGDRQHVSAVPYAIEALNGVPTGTIVPYGGLTAPAGWAICDGRAVSSGDPTYARLSDVIRVQWGSGDPTNPATDFNLPDLRGQFLRGADDRAVGSPDPEAPRMVGSTQAPEVADHAHAAGALIAQVWVTGAGRAISAVVPTDSYCGNHAASAPGASTDCTSSSGAPVVGETGTAVSDVTGETRPGNVAVTYIIKL